MLGYSEKDLNRMINSIDTAWKIIDGPADVEKGLELTKDFLGGLWAEGYFD